MGGLGAGLAIMLILLAWRLSSGPISLAFLSPYIESVLGASNRTFRIGLDDTILTWAGWERTLDIRVLNVRAIGGNGAVIARVPELSLSLSAAALVRGTVAPKSIELFGPSLRLVRHPDGHLEIGFDQSGGGAVRLFESVLAALEEDSDPDNAMSYLSRVTIVDADLTIEDRRLGTSWRAPSSQVNLERTVTGVSGDVSVDLEMGEQETHLAIRADYRAADRRLDLGMTFGAVNPRAFSGVSPGLVDLGVLDLPVRGTVTATVAADGGVEQVAFALTGGPGHLVLPHPMAQRLPVEGLALSGGYEGGADRLRIDEFIAELGTKGRLRLPASAGHKVPLRTVRARGHFLGGEKRLELAAVELDLQGPKASFSATVEGLGGAVSGSAKGVLHNLTAEDLARYWPRAWEPDAHDWCVSRLSDGRISEARAEFSFRSTAEGDFDVTSLNGELDIEGVTVDYLPPMPKAAGVHATARFDTKRFEIEIKGGTVEGLAVGEGRVVFTGLDEADQYAEIDLAIEGMLRNTVNLIDHEPLGFATAIGLEAEKTGGFARTRLKLNFIVEKDLEVDQIEVSGDSEMEEVSVPHIIGGLDLSRGRLKLDVSNQGMTVAGKANLGSIPVDMTWRRNFGSGVPFRSRYEVSGRIDRRQRSEEIGLTFVPFAGASIKGPTDAAVVYTVIDDTRSRVEATLGLTETRLHLADLGWTKAAGVPSEARVDLSLIGDRVSKVDRFTVVAGDLEVDGSATFAPRGLERISFRRFAYGRTDVKGHLVLRPNGGWDADLTGSSFDLEPVLKDLTGGKDGDFEERDSGPGFSITASLDRVRLGPGRWMEGVAGKVVRSRGKWTDIRLNGRFGKDQAFELNIEPGEEGNRKIVIHADDAGEALRRFDLYENMLGGTLDLKGTLDDSLPNAPLKARLVIENYRVIKAPVLTHVLSIMSLTGILEALHGEGLSFLTLDAPLSFEGGLLRVSEAHASGPSLGFTASGSIHFPVDRLELEGEVVPAYVINSLLGRIPVLGKIFTGGEKGSGVFAATYKMAGPIENPKVSVNPLSVLAPGFLRKLFNIFDDVKKEDESPVSRSSGSDTR